MKNKKRAMKTELVVKFDLDKLQPIRAYHALTGRTMQSIIREAVFDYQFCDVPVILESIQAKAANS